MGSVYLAVDHSRSIITTSRMLDGEEARHVIDEEVQLRQSSGEPFTAWSYVFLYRLAE